MKVFLCRWFETSTKCLRTIFANCLPRRTTNGLCLWKKFARRKFCRLSRGPLPTTKNESVRCRRSEAAIGILTVVRFHFGCPILEANLKCNTATRQSLKNFTRLWTIARVPLTISKMWLSFLRNNIQNFSRLFFGIGVRFAGLYIKFLVCEFVFQ